MGEEWRRGWDPETTKPKIRQNNKHLVIGSGPAGLECSCAASTTRLSSNPRQRQIKSSLGGRVLFESGLKGLVCMEAGLLITDFMKYSKKTI